MRRRDFLTGAAALAAYGQIREAEALTPHQRLFSGGVRALVDPVPAGSPLVMLGDSINQNEFAAGTSLAQLQTGLIMSQQLSGEFYQALVTDPRLAFVGYNDLTRTTSYAGNNAPYTNGSVQAYAGTTLTDILAQITPAKKFINGRNGLGVIGGGTNSLTLSDAAFETAHAAILDAAHAAMPWVLWGVQTVRAVSVAASGTGSRTAANIAAKNVKIVSNVAARPWCRLIDLAAYINDGANPGYGLPLNYQTAPYQPSPGGDGLHVYHYGVTVVGYPNTLAFIQAHATAGNAIRLAKTGTALTASIGINTGSAAVNHTATLTITGAANNGSGLIRLTVASTSNILTGQSRVITGVVGTTEANGTWTVTLVDATHFDLQGSAFVNAYVSGGTSPGGVVSGFLPTSMDVAVGSNANLSDCVCSLEANAETGVQTVVLTITPKGSNTSENFIFRPSAIAMATTALQDQWGRLWGDIEVNQGAGWLRMAMNSGERSNSSLNFTAAQIGLFPDGGAALRRFYGCVTPHLKYPVGSTGFNPSFQFIFNPSAGAGPYVLKIRQWDMQIEASPVSP